MRWSDGYFTDLNYTYGYYPNMSLASLRFACLSHGVASPEGNAPTYLELGFGQGVSVNVHAAASDGSFWGTDFSPAHVAEARRMARASGAAVNLFEDSFEDFADRSDLPDFDVVALHGVWSWVSKANRQIIKDLIRRKLRPGGIVYVSYNCLPGWAPIVPLQRLMSLYRERAHGHASNPSRMVQSALDFVGEVSRAGSTYFGDNPVAVRHLERLSRQSGNYLAHEYLNADWHLEHFSDMVRSLEEAKLSFVGSARPLDGVDAMHLGEDARQLLTRIDDDIMRETVRDNLVNRHFRADVFVKGARKLSGRERHDAWEERAFVLTVPIANIPKRIPCARGEAELPAGRYDPIIEGLADDGYRSKTLAELLGRQELCHRRRNDLVEALTILVGAGFASPAQVPSDGSIDQCRALNEHILRRSLVGTDLLHLASPMTGTAIEVPHLSQLFILASKEGQADADALASYVWTFLDGIDERLVRDGRRIESRDETMETLRPSASKFLQFDAPHIKSLGVL